MQALPPSPPSSSSYASSQKSLRSKAIRDLQSRGFDIAADDQVSGNLLDQMKFQSDVLESIYSNGRQNATFSYWRWHSRGHEGEGDSDPEPYIVEIVLPWKEEKTIIIGYELVGASDDCGDVEIWVKVHDGLFGSSSDMKLQGAPMVADLFLGPASPVAWISADDEVFILSIQRRSGEQAAVSCYSFKIFGGSWAKPFELPLSEGSPEHPVEAIQENPGTAATGLHIIRDDDSGDDNEGEAGSKGAADQDEEEYPVLIGGQTAAGELPVLFAAEVSGNGSRGSKSRGSKAAMVLRNLSALEWRAPPPARAREGDPVLPFLLRKLPPTLDAMENFGKAVVTNGGDLLLFDSRIQMVLKVDCVPASETGGVLQPPSVARCFGISGMPRSASPALHEWQAVKSPNRSETNLVYLVVRGTGVLSLAIDQSGPCPGSGVFWDPPAGMHVTRQVVLRAENALGVNPVLPASRSLLSSPYYRMHSGTEGKITVFFFTRQVVEFVTRCTEGGGKSCAGGKGLLQGAANKILPVLLSKDMESLCDVEFTFDRDEERGGGSERILAHRAVLAASSQYFRVMFSNSWKEKSPGNQGLVTVHIRDIQIDVFQVILLYLYQMEDETRKSIRESPLQDNLELLSVCDRFLLKDLGMEVMAYLSSSLTEENCLEIYKAVCSALSFREEVGIIEMIRKYCRSSLGNLAKSSDFTAFCIQNADTLASILREPSAPREDSDLRRKAGKAAGKRKLEQVPESLPRKRSR